MKEAIALTGLVICAIIGVMIDNMEVTTLCIVALIAYIGGNHNGEKRNSRLMQDEQGPAEEEKSWVK